MLQTLELNSKKREKFRFSEEKKFGMIASRSNLSEKPSRIQILKDWRLKIGSV